MSSKLCYQALDALSPNVVKPEYSRENLSPGIVHIGVGNFHRAHQAMYLHQLFNRGEAHNWAIRGAGTKSYDMVMREKLKSQDWLTTVVELDKNGLSAQVCASMLDFIENSEAALIDALSSEEIRIVSLTITEGGYFIDTKTDRFDLSHPEIQRDIANFENPTTVFGVLIKALERRRDTGIPAFTVMSCDNIPHNGEVAKRGIAKMSAEIDKELSHWIASNVTFPNSMVDCITPATSNMEKEKLKKLFNIEDNAPVFCEPFRQWVLEDNFANGRPPLENVGVRFVKDVAPYELMKLRILNGGHAAIAYPAALLSIHYVHDVMANDLIRQYLSKLTREEIIPSLEIVPGVDFAEYSALIESRFANPEVKDTVSRLCQDASNRLPKFILPIIKANLQSNRHCNGLALVIALWCHLCAMGADPTSDIVIQDEQAERLKKQSLLAEDNPVSFLQMNDIFGELANKKHFAQCFSTWLAMLSEKGPVKTLAHYLQ